MQDQSIYITGNSFRTIVNSFYKAIDNRDNDTFILLNSFLYQQLTESFNHGNIKLFENFSNMSPYYYEYVLKKLNGSITYSEIYKVCADRAVRDLKDKITYGFNYRLKEDELSLEDKQEINRYTKILLNRFSELINICLRNKDLNNLSSILNQLHQVSDSYNYKLTNLKFDIQLKKTQKLTGEELKEFKNLEKIYEIESFTDTTVRLIFKATLFWSLFLFNTKVLNYDEIQKIIETYEGYKGYIEQNFVEDLLILRGLRYENEFSWGRWDYTERIDGVVYSPPSAEFWITLGAVLYILKNKDNINFQLESRTAEEVNSHEYLVRSMDEILKSLIETGFDRFGILLDSVNQQDFNLRINQLQTRLEALRNSTITNKEELISKIPLDPEYVLNFRNIMCEGWEKGNALQELFTHFKNISLVSEEDNTDSKLFHRVGAKNEIWMGYKTCLIRNENFYTPMFGIDRIGQNLASREENTFFGSLISKNYTEIGNLFSGINAAIISIQKSGFEASVIMIGLDTWYNYFRDLKSEDFIFDWNDKQGYNFSDFGGLYKKIPIVKFRSDLIRDDIIVADFKASFLLQQKITQDAFKGVLVNVIEGLTEEESEAIILENPNYWQNGLTNNQAKMKIMNSIKVDFYLLQNFIISNEKAYSLLSLNK